MQLIQYWKRLRQVSTPLVAIETADQDALVRRIRDVEEAEDFLCYEWDFVRGLRGSTPKAQKAAAEVIPVPEDPDDPPPLTDPAEALIAAERLPADSVLLYHNAHRFVQDAKITQALLNLKVENRANGRCVALVCPEISLPPELSRDVIVVDDPLPTDEELREIVSTLLKDNDLTTENGAVERAAYSLRGLSQFPAEQIAAMSIEPNGDNEATFDQEYLTESMRKVVEQTEGLSFDRGGPTLDQVAGLSNLKEFGRRLLDGQESPLLIVRIDEVEKQLAGATGDVQDTSGVSGDAFGQTLSFMEDHNASGLIMCSPPGCGKSLFSKSLGNSGGIPSISLDFGAFRNSLVGASEARIRQGLKQILAIGGQRVFFVATCNKLRAMPPEFLRRFRCGIWYVDLPDEEENAALWDLYLAKYELEGGPAFDSKGWTGAEIRNVCELAWKLKSTVDECEKYIVPVCKSDPKGIEALRSKADGRWLSANYAGTYDAQHRQKSARTGRKLAVGGTK